MAKKNEKMGKRESGEMGNPFSPFNFQFSPFNFQLKKSLHRKRQRQKNEVVCYSSVTLF